MSAPHPPPPLRSRRVSRARKLVCAGGVFSLLVAVFSVEPGPARADGPDAPPTTGPDAPPTGDSALPRGDAPGPRGDAARPRDASASARPPVELGTAEIIRVHSHRPNAGLGALTAADAAHRGGRAALEVPVFATTITLGSHAGETRSAAELLARTVGVNVRTLGGLGGYSALSVRGAPPGQTSVLVDGVPLSRTSMVGVDLGRFELSTFSEIAVFRGGVPAALGGAALGGVVDLRTQVGPGAEGETLMVTAGLGSYGARHLAARLGGQSSDGARAHVLSASYRGATGDYAFFNDNGTNLTTRDDRIEARLNNGYDQGELVGRSHWRGTDTDWELGTRVSAREQGVPGPGNDQAVATTLSTLSQFIDATRRGRRAWGLASLSSELKLFAIGELQRYRDPDGEVGAGGQDRRYTSASVGTIAALSWVASRTHELSSATELRLDGYRDRDLMAAPMAETTDRTAGGRLALGAAFSDQLRLGTDGRLVLVPALRLDLLHTRPAAETNAPSGMAPAPRTELAPSPRLSALLHLGADASLKGNLGYYFRAPTLSELYGDRGYLVGNSELASERGPSADLGVVFSPGEALGPIDRVFVEAAVFGALPVDTIAWVSGGGLVARPENVGDARLVGTELTATARASRWLTATVSYTGLLTEQVSAQAGFDGKALPRRPRHELSARLDLAQHLGTTTPILWADYTFASGSYLDLANLSPVPRRALIGVGAKLVLARGLVVGVEVKNLGDERIEYVTLEPAPRPELASVPRAISDYGGYPLPGRSLYATIEWHQ